MPRDGLDSIPREDIPRRIASLLRYLEQTRGGSCSDCSAPICGHQALLSMATGFMDSPLCPDCLSDSLGRDRKRLGEELFVYMQSKECYRTAWLRACGDEGIGPAQALRCLAGSAAEGEPGRGPERRGPVEPAPAAPEAAAAAAEWDAGDMGCGDLVLELRFRLRAMLPGQVLKLTARDPGAPQDLPAWCGMTGHRLVRREHPVYWIQKKET